MKKQALISKAPALLPRAAFIFLFFIHALQMQGTILYVKSSAGGANDGTSWTDAFTDLQSALAAAVAGDEIWVAAGTYLPTTDGNRSISFAMKNGVAIYGGFPATGDPGFDDRDWTVHVTTLSGDLGGAGNGDNSYNVIRNTGLNNTAILDGFTITGGNANGFLSNQWGGGMNNLNSSPTLKNCTFSGNSADLSGGGMRNFGNSSPNLMNCSFSGNNAAFGGGISSEGVASTPTWTNCTFSYNSASEGGGVSMRGGTLVNCSFTSNSAVSGAGLFIIGTTSATVTNCAFSSNSATHGSGMYVRSASPHLENCTFSSNWATTDGGGLYNENSPSHLENCTFSENSTVNGGGIYNKTSSPNLEYCTFSSNTVSGNGGGLHNFDSSPLLSGCAFYGNEAANGGGMYNNSDASDPSLTNCLFSGNLAANGGGMYGFGADPALTNCTFSGNKATTSGGAMYNQGSAFIMKNCIVWGNTIFNTGGGSFTVSYSIVQGGQTGTDNLNADPFFVDANGADNIPGTADDDLRLQACSPATDAGLDASITVSTDLDGNDRKVDAITGGNEVDMGCYEFENFIASGDRWYVNASAATTGNGTSWSCVFKTLQSALAAADFGDEIWVKGGTYYPDEGINQFDNFRGSAFVMKNGVAIYGGFAGGENALSERPSPLVLTVLSGDLMQNDLQILTQGALLTHSTRQDNSYHVIFNDNNGLDASAILDGFTISSGNANSAVELYSRGGGMYNASSSPALVNCVFFRNSASKEGGAMFNLASSSPALTRCSFTQNYGTISGAICNFTSCSPTLTNCTFLNNATLNHGGGMFNVGNSSPTLTNCAFSGNSASQKGGGMRNLGSSPTLINCTFKGNTATNGGGGMENSSSSSPTLKNCILWGNSSGIVNNSSTATVSYSIVQDGYSPCANCPNGNGNIDPLFLFTGGGMTLNGCSPAIDAGDASGAPADDLNGNPRPYDAALNVPGDFDLGAYEFQSGTPAPTARCKNIAVELAGINVTVTGNQVDDNSKGCGEESFQLNGQASLTFDCDDVGIPQNVTLTLTDYFANTASCSATVTVVDTENPTITCPAPMTVNNAPGQCGATVSYTLTGSDNCSYTLSQTAGLASGATFSIGTTTNTWQVTDPASNSATCSFTITVVDNENPAVVCKPHTVTLDANGSGSITPANVYQSGSDNCGTVNLQSVSPNAFTCANVGANTVTLTAYDGNGNISFCNATVTVQLDPNSVIAYALLAQEEVHMHKTLVGGNVGVWQAGKDAKIHDYSTVTGWVKAPGIDLENNSVITGAQYLAQAPQPSVASFKYNTQTDPPTDVVIPDNYAGIYQLTGSLFRKIEVGKNSTVQFMDSGEIFIKELKTKDADNGLNTSVLFSGTTELIIRKRLELGKRTLFNWGGASSVKAFVQEDDVKVKELCKVNASIDCRFKNLDMDDGDQPNHTLMTGQFIAKKIDSKKWTDWNWSSAGCPNTPPSQPLVVPGDQLVFIAAPAHDKVNLQWVSNTEAKNERFVVERSADGVDFEPLLEAPAQGSEAVASYRDQDGSPQEGANFYRVRAVFDDGTSLVSEVRPVHFFLDKDDLNVFPNPASVGVYIFKESYVGKPAVVRLYNSLGRPVRELRFDALPAEPFYLEVSDLPGGLYWLTVSAEGFRERSKQVVVGE